MMKSNLKFLFVIPIILLLNFCGYTKEEKKLIKEYETQGKENAINYIEDKYGFTPNIVKIEAIKEDPYMIPDFSTPPTGRVSLELSHNNKKFIVEIQGDRKTIDGGDNYQYEEIESDILEIIKKDTNMDPYKHSINFGIFTTKNLINEYYNKDNLNELIDSLNFNIVLEYINKPSLINNDYKNITENFINCSQFGIINYKSMEQYNNKLEKMISFEMFDNYITGNAINIDYAFFINQKNIVHYNMDMIEFDDIKYYDLNKKESIIVNKSKLDDIKNWNGHGVLEAIQISDAYSIETDAINLYAFIPLNKTKNIEEEKLKIAIQCESKSGKKYSANSLYYGKVGNYYGTYLFLGECISDIKFAIIQNK